MTAPLSSTALQKRVERLSAKERLLEAADSLFYEGGIHSVGIDAVIERAGVAKATLYSTFGSKDALVRAYLEARHATRKARLTAWLERYENPRARLLGVFDAMGELIKAKGFRGCAFARANAESLPSPNVRTACDEARSWMRNLFTELASNAGVAKGQCDRLAMQLHMLYDGASVMGQSDASDRPALAAQEAAASLLDAALGQDRIRRVHKGSAHT